jgi:hypothetical protein
VEEKGKEEVCAVNLYTRKCSSNEDDYVNDSDMLVMTVVAVMKMV